MEYDENVIAMLECAAPAPAPASGACRVCGCTDDCCSQCIERTGAPCYWVIPGALCSACATVEQLLERSLELVRAGVPYAEIVRLPVLATARLSAGLMNPEEVCMACYAGVAVGHWLHDCGEHTAQCGACHGTGTEDCISLEPCEECGGDGFDDGLVRAGAQPIRQRLRMLVQQALQNASENGYPPDWSDARGIAIDIMDHEPTVQAMVESRELPEGEDGVSLVASVVEELGKESERRCLACDLGLPCSWVTEASFHSGARMDATFRPLAAQLATAMGVPDLVDDHELLVARVIERLHVLEAASMPPGLELGALARAAANLPSMLVDALRELAEALEHLNGPNAYRNIGVSRALAHLRSQCEWYQWCVTVRRALETVVDAPGAIVTILRYAGFDLSVEVVALWTTEQRREALSWAVEGRASVPPLPPPAFLDTCASEPGGDA